MKYNFKFNLRRHASPHRTYALNDESALILCDYTRAKRPRIPFPYFLEAWAGHEYSAAALMISRGLVTEGLRVVESVRRRHDGLKRNPWNEPECGHHYARAMAAWGPLLLMAGFQYDAPGRRITAKPRVSQSDFTSFWSTGTGWGIFSQSVRDGKLRFTLSVKAGNLAANSVTLSRLGGGAAESSATVGGNRLAHKVRSGESEIVVKFDSEVKLAEANQLVLTV
jgi:hypothetical protein